MLSYLLSILALLVLATGHGFFSFLVIFSMPTYQNPPENEGLTLLSHYLAAGFEGWFEIRVLLASYERRAALIYEEMATRPVRGSYIVHPTSQST